MHSHLTRIWRAGSCLAALALLVALVGVSSAAEPRPAQADGGAGCKPALAGAAAPDGCQPAAAGSTTSQAPALGTKNATTPPASDLNGVTRSGPDAAGPKGDAAAAEPQTIAPATAGPSGWRYVTCGAGGGGGWTTSSVSWQVIRSCAIDVPEAGFVYVDATASLGIASGSTAFEARFGLNIDNATGNSSTDRWVNIYTDSGDGTDKSVADTMIQSVSAGTHTIYFLGTRYNGSGTVQLYNPTLSVLYFPSSSTDVLACGVTSNTTWTTTSTSFQTIRSCTLNVPQSGFVYVSGTASVGLSDTAFESRFRVGIDTTSGTASSDRWVNVYTDGGDGTDETVATSLVAPVATGAHTFYFLGTRYNGTGTVQLYDPSLSVLYFPSPNVTVKVCGASGSDVWTNNTISYTVIRSCTLNAPRGGLAFLDANASAGLNASSAGNEWEGQFRFGIDNSSSGTPGYDRWINVYTDSGDGTDRALALSGVASIGEGIHTFYFLGKRYNGAGTLRLYSPSLTVLIPGGATFLPLLHK